MSFRAFLNGKEGDVVAVPKNSRADLTGLLLKDDGTSHDLSTATLDMVIYSRADRAVAATATHAAVIVTAAQGIFTVAIADAAAIYGPGRFYAFMRRTLAGDVTFANKYTILDVK